jgi:UDP-GlcNAc:undecaprenyl-phosphate GlcNAc-1-phosphate transferase
LQARGAQVQRDKKLKQLFFGLILTLFSTPALIWAAPQYGLLDHPDERKHHAGAIPVVGGLAMAFAIAVAAAWYLAGTDIFWGLFASVSIIVAVGFLDDRSGLPVRARFVAQGVAASIMALFAGAQLASLGDLFGFGPVALGALAVPFTVFAIVGVANAVNMADGMDGLAGGLALIATSFIAVAAYFSGRETTLIAMLILGGALIGFLFFNMRWPWQRRAKVFMGDSGSLMLGFLLAWAVIRVTQSEKNPLPPAAALWFFAIPLADTLSLMLRRMLKGKSPFHPGRDHLHHILLRVGYRDCQVVMFIHLVAVLFGLVGFLGWRLGVPDAVMFYGALVVFALYCYGVQHAWKLMRLIVALPHPHPHHPHD